MRLFVLIGLIFVIGCKRSYHSSKAGLDYFPSAAKMEKGLVWKYYFHVKKRNQPRKTDIVYRKMILDNDVMQRSDYNAGYQLTHKLSFQTSNDKWILLSEKSLNYRGLITERVNENSYEIGENNIHTNWNGSNAKLEKSLMLNGSGVILNIQQNINNDTIIDSKPAKSIEGFRTIIQVKDSIHLDTTQMPWSRLYQKGLGMIRGVMSNDKGEYRVELDEIMSIEEFERRSNHGTNRVAYIDTLLTLDDHTQFRPCYNIEQINDYYNDRRSEIVGGKGRLRTMLKKKLDPSKIKGESGYLTYRFVVNCEGEAGWFVTEEASLEYEKKQFSKQCRMHLYELLKAEENWTHLEIGQNPRDAYTYITFKLKDGEIIELLP